MKVLIMAKGKFQQARVLVALTIGSIPYKPNDLIEADASLIKLHKEQGELDDSAAAVNYCLKELKAKVKKHEAPVEEGAGITKEEAEKALADAETALTEATTDEEKTKANEALEAAKTVLADLG
jgi:peptidoglycan hydrolase CwlO-like protein